MPGKPSKPISNWLAYAAGFSALLLLGYLAEISFIQNEVVRLAATDITFMAANLLATAALIGAAVRSLPGSRRGFLAWGFLALAQIATILGDVVWAVLVVGFDLPAFPSAADIFYLAYYPLFLTGIILLPGRRASAKAWIKKGLDLGIIVIAAILVFWNFLIGPVALTRADEPFVWRALSMAYPTGDLLLLGGVLVLLYHRANSLARRPVLLLAFSMLFLIGADCIYSLQSLEGVYVNGGLLNLGWMAAYLLTAFAGLFQIKTAAASVAVDQPELKPDDLLDRIGTWLPFLCVAGAFVLLVESADNSLPMDFSSMAVGVGAIVGLVLARQVTAQAENRRLYHQLLLTIEQVQRQSTELKMSNENLVNEIAIRLRAEEQLSYDALHDNLTGLPNRALFMDRLGQAIEYSRRSSNLFSVLFIDLDSFKVVNDSLGHSIGDELLIAIALRLRSCLRSSDTVARFGGDEFVLLLETNGDEQNVMQVVNRIQSMMIGPFQVKGHDIFTSASLGLVTSLSGYTHPEEALRDADIAMYQAKALGKSCMETFSPEMRRQAVQRLELETSLRQGLQNYEFELYYQPIYSLTSGQIVGFEALVRWNHPSRGLLLPEEFLQVAEETGLILPMGRWVLRQACTQISQWRQMYPGYQDATINVNISSKQFKQPDLVDQIVSVLRETGLPANALKLEITESVVIDHPAIVTELFEKLCQMGVQLQVDDFGTGYSSLSYIQQFPIQSIKIDRSFISEICKPGKNADLVRTMVRMAHDLGMDAIAEGVETEEQLDELKRLMCHYGQGYLMAKPMSRGAVLELLETKTAVWA